MSCRKTHRSPFGQLAAASEVPFKTIGIASWVTVDELVVIGGLLAGVSAESGSLGVISLCRLSPFLFPTYLDL